MDLTGNSDFMILFFYKEKVRWLIQFFYLFTGCGEGDEQIRDAG